MEIKKFVDIENLREKDTLLNGLVTRGRNDLNFRPGNQIQITTKVDGSNASVGYNAETGKLECWSRRLPLKFDNTLNGFFEYVQSLDVSPFKNHPTYRVFGEWMPFQRTNKITYDEKMNHRWIIYSIYDIKEEKWLTQDIVKSFCEESGLEYVEVLYEGPFISWDHCREFMNKSKYGDKQEGIVIRNMDGIYNPDVKYPWILKIVGEEFSEIMKHSRKPKDPEEERRKQGAKGKAAEILSTVITKNRIEKAITKFQEDGILPKQLSDKDMGNIAKILPKAIYEDILKEEPETLQASGEYGSKVLGQMVMAIVRPMILG